jgi:uncharacterized protein with PIN domain
VHQKSVQFRFYEELNDFLPKVKRKKQFIYMFHGRPGIKDAIEAIGVPHTEVDLIIVNGKSVGFGYKLQNADRVAVYPVFESIDITPIVKLRSRPLRVSKFILDVHLGKLARMLRMLGFDTVYDKNYDDNTIISQALKEQRTILTRDQNLLKIKSVTHGYWLRSTEPLQQIVEVIDRFDLKSQVSPFIRCMLCNGEIKEIEKHKVLNKVPSQSLKYHDEFFYCLTCGKIYWKGSHYLKMEKKISNILHTSK